MPRRPVPTQFWQSRRTTSGPPTTLPKRLWWHRRHHQPARRAIQLSGAHRHRPVARARGQARRRPSEYLRHQGHGRHHQSRARSSRRPQGQPEFSVLSGFDEYYLVNRASGGNGVLCGLTNVEPELFVRLHGAYQAGDFATAIECAGRISSLMAVYDACDLFISAIKVAVNIKRVFQSRPRSLIPHRPSDNQKATIEQLLS